MGTEQVPNESLIGLVQVEPSLVRVGHVPGPGPGVFLEKYNTHHQPQVEFGQAPGFGKVRGHKLSKVLAIWAEN